MDLIHGMFDALEERRDSVEHWGRSVDAVCGEVP
jgi:hypothetical protein